MMILGASNLSSFKFYKTTFQYVLPIEGYFLENNRCHQLFLVSNNNVSFFIVRAPISCSWLLLVSIMSAICLSFWSIWSTSWVRSRSKSSRNWSIWSCSIFSTRSLECATLSTTVSTSSTRHASKTYCVRLLFCFSPTPQAFLFALLIHACWFVHSFISPIFHLLYTLYITLCISIISRSIHFLYNYFIKIDSKLSFPYQ